MNHPRWIGTLTDAQVDKAFGNGSGQIGLTILRCDIPPSSGDWSAEVGAASRAKSHGAIIFGSPWSPPASMKSNGSTVGGSLNSSSYGAYANHLRDFANYMSSNGAALYAVSVQNEPDYLPDYESCGWSSSQMRTFLDNNASVIPVLVIAPETVNPKSAWYSALSSASQLDIYADHLYGGSPTTFSKEHWMTEHYTDSSISGDAWPQALDAGQEVHNCMTNNYNAYIWWYVRRSYGLLNESGNITKRGYVMSHFTKYVRPGYVRVDATSSPQSNVYTTAYKSGNTLVIVAINKNSSSQSVTFSISGGSVGSYTKYETTSSSNMANRGSVGGSDTLAGYSMNTYVGTIGSSSTTTTTTAASTTTTTSGSTTTTTSGGSTDVWLEAECGNVGSLWNIVSDSSASGGQYVTIQSGNNSTGSAPSSSSGHITYDFSVSSSGTCNLYARVITPNGNDDSFWVRMDGGSWYQWNNIGPTSSWAWYQCQSYSLSSGSHTLTIAYREDGARLDKLYIGTSGTPSGTGGTATNCGGSTTTTTTAASTTTTAGTTTTTTAGTTTTTTSGASVSLLGSWATGTSHTTESGSNRALIFIAHAESTSTINLSSVSYGGQAMTKVVDYSYNASSGYAYAAAFILTESGVAAASNSNFSVTWGGTAPGSAGYSSVFLGNVNQSAPTGATGTGGRTSNPVTTSALATSSGDMVLLGATCGNSGSYTLNNSFIEGNDQQINGTVTGVTGRKSATGANETPSATYSSTINRQMIIGLVVKHQ
jgi:O-glycosyl hydrolase